MVGGKARIEWRLGRQKGRRGERGKAERRKESRRRQKGREE